jgi:hypothetical protein
MTLQSIFGHPITHTAKIKSSTVCSLYSDDKGYRYIPYDLKEGKDKEVLFWLTQPQDYLVIATTGEVYLLTEAKPVDMEDESSTLIAPPLLS